MLMVSCGAGQLMEDWCFLAQGTHSKNSCLKILLRSQVVLAAVCGVKTVLELPLLASQVMAAWLFSLVKPVWLALLWSPEPHIFFSFAYERAPAQHCSLGS